LNSGDSFCLPQHQWRRIFTTDIIPSDMTGFFLITSLISKIFSDPAAAAI
jgi:hypothetical protein